MTFTVSSPAFRDGSAIPTKYTRDGKNASPPIEWREAPPETRSFALLVEDPDAPSGTFRHWAIYNIPADSRQLPEAVSVSEGEDMAQGVNGFGHAGYDGPAPPKGHGTHHYHFRLAALDVPRLDLQAMTKAEEVWKAARPHIIAEAECVGTYER